MNTQFREFGWFPGHVWHDPAETEREGRQRRASLEATPGAEAPDDSEQMAPLAREEAVARQFVRRRRPGFDERSADDR